MPWYFYGPNGGIKDRVRKDNTPPGAIVLDTATSAPVGYLLCDGSAVSRSVYFTLFAAVGTTYGIGNGLTTFNVPDLRDVFPRAAGGAVAPLSTGGSTTHGHTIASHSHTVPSHYHGMPPTFIAHSHTSPAHNHGLGSHQHDSGGATSEGASIETAELIANGSPATAANTTHFHYLDGISGAASADLTTITSGGIGGMSGGPGFTDWSGTFGSNGANTGSVTVNTVNHVPLNTRQNFFIKY